MTTDPYREGRVRTLDGIRELYRHPAALTAGKERPTLDEMTSRFLERARFASVGTFDAQGNADVSPRGGPSGYIRVLDESHLAIADFAGNNRLDTLQNIVATGRIALLVVVPGMSETVRINGSAWLSADPQLVAGFDLPKVPKAAIVVQVETTYMHCAKAFLRSGMWDPQAWAELADTPDGAAILSCQRVADADAATVRQILDSGYESALADER